MCFFEESVKIQITIVCGKKGRGRMEKKGDFTHKLKYIGLNAMEYHTLYTALSIFVCSIHMVIFLAFIIGKAYLLAGINIGSILIYVICIALSKKKKIRMTYHIIIGEVFVFSILMTRMLGREYLFAMFCIATIPFTYLTSYLLETSGEGEKYIKPGYYCMAAIVLFYLEYFILSADPYFLLPEGADANLLFFQVFNFSVAICCSMIGGFALSRVAVENIRITKNNMHRIEELMREAEESNEAKSNFLANMSHEIRTPMNAICGMSDMLLDEELSEEGKELAASIKSSGNSLLSIINDILDFSKLESGKMVIAPEEYYISSVVHDLLNVVEVRVKDKPVKLIAKVQDSIPRKLYGDSGRIRQILLNIMGNATKFTHEGSVTLEVSWQQEEENHGRLLFSVKDTGIGIKKENLEKLFDAFEQVDLNKNRGIEGTGLGLSISKLLVEEMGGKIWVESEYEKGSNFHFFIKQDVIDAAPCEYGKGVQKTEIKQFKITFKAPEAKVMVVDDVKVNLRVAAGILKKFGIVPDLIDNAVDSVETLKKRKDYDLIFMDHMMPEVDGIEATGMIRGMNEEYTDQVPIVALSANAVKGMEQEFFTAGMNDFLPKPIEVARMSEILLKWLPEEKIVREEE